MNWSGFVPLVAMEAPGCPRFEIEDVAKRMAIEFYQETRAWRVEGVTGVFYSELLMFG